MKKIFIAMFLMLLGTAAFTQEFPGFRDIPWGAKVSEHKDKQLIKSSYTGYIPFTNFIINHPSLTSYEIKEDYLKLGDAKLTRIFYFFDDNKFAFAALGMSAGEWHKAVERLTQTFGKSQEIIGFEEMNSPSSSYYFFKNDKIVVYANYYRTILYDKSDNILRMDRPGFPQTVMFLSPEYFDKVNYVERDVKLYKDLLDKKNNPPKDL